MSNGKSIIGFFRGVRRTTPTSTFGFGINARPLIKIITKLQQFFKNII